MAAVKKRLSSDDRKAKILAVAIKLVGKVGSDKITRRKVAIDAGGISESLVTHYFGNIVDARKLFKRAAAKAGIVDKSSAKPAPVAKKAAVKKVALPPAPKAKKTPAVKKAAAKKAAVKTAARAPKAPPALPPLPPV